MIYSTIKADAPRAATQSKDLPSSVVARVSGFGSAVMAVAAALMARLGLRESK